MICLILLKREGKLRIKNGYYVMTCICFKLVFGIPLQRLKTDESHQKHSTHFYIKPLFS